LRVIGLAAVASHFPGFAKWSYAAAHSHAEGEKPKPQHYTPQFFSAPDYAVIARLTELIIPSDETPGALEAGACEFVDFMVAHDAEQQPPLRAGLSWLTDRCQREFSRPFLELTEPRAARIPGEASARRRTRSGILPARSRSHRHGFLFDTDRISGTLESRAASLGAFSRLPSYPRSGAHPSAVGKVVNP